MADYILGLASADEAANFDHLKQEAAQAQTQVFNANNSNRRMLFFAFDGTGDNKNDPTIGPPSNVARLYESARVGLDGEGISTGKAFYYQGPGTQDNPISKLIDGATGITVPETVKTAYDDLVRYANENPGVEITIGTTGFSRGAAAARAFLNAVWEQGIPDTSSRVSLGFDPESNQERFAYTRYVVEPQKADLGIALLYDTVATGFVRDEKLLKIPPAPGLQVYQIAAADEHRSLFSLDSVIDPSNPFDPRIHQVFVAGAHHDIGGGAYGENGIGLETLGIGHSWLKNSGMPMGALPADLLPGSQELVIHDSFKGFYGPDATPETGGYVAEPRWQSMRTYANSAFVTQHELLTNDDGSHVETLMLSNGSKQVFTRDSNWQIENVSVTSQNADGSVLIVVSDGDGSVTSSTLRTIYDDGLSAETITTPAGAIRRITDTEGNATDTPIESGASQLNQAVANTAIFLALVKAIQSGQPIPILSGSINTLASLNPSHYTHLASSGSKIFSGKANIDAAPLLA